MNSDFPKMLADESNSQSHLPLHAQSHVRQWYKQTLIQGRAPLAATAAFATDTKRELLKV